MKLSAQMRLLSEHRTIEDESKLGKGVFSEPRHKKRKQITVKDEVSSVNDEISSVSARIGKEFQATLPELLFNSVERGDKLLDILSF